MTASAPKLTKTQRSALTIIANDRHANTVPRPTLRVLARHGLIDSAVRHCEITDAGRAALKGEGTMTAPKLTESQLANVVGRPGELDYHGPHWARIAAKRDRIVAIEAHVARLMAQRADAESDLVDLIESANTIIHASRAALRGDS